MHFRVLIFVSLHGSLFPTSQWRRRYAWNFIPLRQRERKNISGRIGDLLIRLTPVLVVLGLVVLIGAILTGKG